MLSDEDKTRIREEEEIRMDVRRNSLQQRCCCTRHCWWKALGAALILALIVGLVCHHGDGYRHDKLLQNGTSETTTD